MDDEEKELYSYNMPAILLMNKIDLVTSKLRLRSLQNELEDLCPFEKIFHVSCETGFGLDAVREFIIDRSPLRPWKYYPTLNSTQSEVQKAEECLKQVIMEWFFREMPY